MLLAPEFDRRDKWDNRFIELTKLVASWSKDPSTKVGSVLVRPDRTIASMGFNGFPRGVPDKPEWYLDKSFKYPMVRHAETNALSFLREDAKGYTLYVYPLFPCASCAGEIIQRGIRRLVARMPKAGYDRMTSDPQFNFHISELMFKEAGVEYNIGIEND